MCLRFVASLIVLVCPFLIMIWIPAKANELEAECYCGHRELEKGKPEKLIINGTEPGPYKYPFVLGIIDLESGIKHCTASLISPTTALSAAHCGTEEPSSYKIAFIGKEGEPIKTLPVKQIINHPDFDPEESGIAEHDIAVWLLDDKVDCHQYSIPVCLPEYDLSKEGQELYTAGTGENSKDGEDKPNQPMLEGKAKQTKEDCEDYQICTQGSDDTVTCKGDSGGPIFLEHDKVMYILGVLSGAIPDFQEGMCSRKDLTFHSNVYHYLKFIKENVNDLPKPQKDKK